MTLRVHLRNENFGQFRIYQTIVIAICNYPLDYPRLEVIPVIVAGAEVVGGPGHAITCPPQRFPSCPRPSYSNV
jgi:hypothetical protein